MGVDQFIIIDGCVNLLSWESQLFHYQTVVGQHVDVIFKGSNACIVSWHWVVWNEADALDLCIVKHHQILLGLVWMEQSKVGFVPGMDMKDLWNLGGPVTVNQLFLAVDVLIKVLILVLNAVLGDRV